MYISKIGIVFYEIYANNRASMSQTVQECRVPRPEGLVMSVAKLVVHNLEYLISIHIYSSGMIL